MLKAKILGWLGRRGIRIVTRNDPGFDAVPRNLEAEFLQVHAACAPFTCTSVENQYALWRAARYVVRANVPGDFVECGVYKGGSVIVAAMAFKELGDASRKFYLYDTFEGMPAPTARDVDFAGRTPEEHLKTWGAARMGEMANSALDEVRRNVLSSGLPAERFVFVRGKVEETLPGQMPAGAISILRLDTDWYESTRHELEHLFPRLSRGGVLIVDDYGFWRGAREACDEYFREHGVEMLLNRVDRLGAVIGVKG
jgi:O-methyltransferase